jgi:hypothetical protein
VSEKDKYGEVTGKKFQEKSEKFAGSEASRKAARDARDEIEGGEPKDMKDAERRGREPARGGRATE